MGNGNVNIALLIFGLILLIHLVRGAKKGALKMLFGLLSWIFILVFVLLATPQIDRLLTDYTPLDEMIQEKVAKQTQARWERQKATVTRQVTEDLKKKIQDQASPLAKLGRDISEETRLPLNLMETYLNDCADRIYAKLPEPLQKIYRKGQLKLQLTTDQMEGTIRESVDQAGKNLADQLAAAITGWLMRVIAFLLALVIARILVAIVAALIDTASHVPVISGISRMLGGLMGLGIGLIDVCFFMFLIEIFSWTTLGAYWTDQIQSSAILNLISGLNPLTLIIR